MINDLITVSVVHFVRMHFSHHLFLIIICCSHIICLSIEWSTFPVLVRVIIIHLIHIIVKVCSIVNNIDIIMVEHLSVFIVLLSFLLLMLLSTRLSRRATLSSLHMHQIVLNVSIKLNVELAANIANYIPNFIEVLSLIDVIIFEIVQELLLVLIWIVFLIFFSAKTKYFSIFFLVVW
jgi:hypothetical protein